MEVRGVEPLSEKCINTLSPSAVIDLNSHQRTDNDIISSLVASLNPT